MNEHPDLIFLDINMPGMNGWDFLDEYKMLDEEYKSRMIVVMLSTSTNPDDREKALQYGINYFESKPLTVERLELLLDQFF